MASFAQKCTVLPPCMNVQHRAYEGSSAQSPSLAQNRTDLSPPPSTVGHSLAVVHVEEGVPAAGIVPQQTGSVDAQLVGARQEIPGFGAPHAAGGKSAVRGVWAIQSTSRAAISGP